MPNKLLDKAEQAQRCALKLLRLIEGLPPEWRVKTLARQAEGMVIAFGLRATRIKEDRRLLVAERMKARAKEKK
jgi:hypothetical protein